MQSQYKEYQPAEFPGLSVFYKVPQEELEDWWGVPIIKISWGGMVFRQRPVPNRLRHLVLDLYQHIWETDIIRTTILN